MLYETWISTPSLFTLLILLFDRSEFLAETAIRTPDLVETLVLGGQLRRQKDRGQILDELRHGAEEGNQLAWIRRYHEAEFMRLGLRDILGLTDLEENLRELSGLADACLEYALQAAMREQGLKTPPFAIIGFGKLGGSELTYGSDLDVTFVARARIKSLPALQKIATRVLELLSSQTEYGVAFTTDARLRPDGNKGLLVNTLQAYQEYYSKRAMLWEIQAISRSRTVAGDTRTGQGFQKLAAQLCDFSQATPPAAAYRQDWMREIHHMRTRIEKERTPAGKDSIAIKTGRGGLIDAEFVAQTLCLAHGRLEPNTRRALERARETGAIHRASADRLLQHYGNLLRIECVLRRWSFVGEAMLPEDPAAMYRVAVRCGYHDSEEFLRAVAEHRSVLREEYDRLFLGGDQKLLECTTS